MDLKYPPISSGNSGAIYDVVSDTTKVVKIFERGTKANIQFHIKRWQEIHDALGDQFMKTWGYVPYPMLHGIVDVNVPNKNGDILKLFGLLMDKIPGVTGESHFKTVFPALVPLIDGAIAFIHYDIFYYDAANEQYMARYVPGLMFPEKFEDRKPYIDEYTYKLLTFRPYEDDRRMLQYKAITERYYDMLGFLQTHVRGIDTEHWNNFIVHESHRVYFIDMDDWELIKKPTEIPLNIVKEKVKSWVPTHGKRNQQDVIWDKQFIDEGIHIITRTLAIALAVENLRGHPYLGKRHSWKDYRDLTQALIPTDKIYKLLTPDKIKKINDITHRIIDEEKKIIVALRPHYEVLCHQFISCMTEQRAVGAYPDYPPEPPPIPKTKSKPKDPPPDPGPRQPATGEYLALYLLS